MSRDPVNIDYVLLLMHFELGVPDPKALMVSWIRKRDLHILTAGSTTYTSDQRFQVIRPENSGNWTLQIKYPQPRDSGIYECQINTEPKMSLSYTFSVI
ncbi:zwei Ig domain protein zig-8-like, partial [Rhagoletis pomonella]|uniref:zwei Ig domain protein zig-8-like n=1 Tax=Rhagoletis pomonella TaxID=28610 RepID=UPI00177D6BE8